MKFRDFVYERPNIDVYKQRILELTAMIGEGHSLEKELKTIHNFFQILDEIDTLDNLASIRYSVNTKDPFYEQEMDFADLNRPVIQEFTNQFNAKLLKSNHRPALEKNLGSFLFKQAELAQKTFSPEIIPDLQKENQLSTEYHKLLASAKIDFDGGVYNLSQMGPFAQSTNRDTRHRAQHAISGFLANHEDEIDRIYDQLVQLRTQIAHKLGYENFIQLGYDRLRRTDYTWKEVKQYRDQVFEHIVPLVTELAYRQGKRIGIPKFKSYDLALKFLSGNPSPKGDRAWQVERAIQMYHELSPETESFFNRMVDMEVLELDSKPGKTGGGWCTYIPGYETPYIFANFNGTTHDVEVLTHEAGHAFQVYLSRNLIPSYRWPTLEACEIHSMSMEFLTWPWMNLFFENDLKKYQFDHVASSISFLPYGVLVDEFQHEIYAHPEMTPQKRKETWHQLEKKYLPFKDYDDDQFMSKGTFWFKQGHIFSDPFYYIDYTLAQISAFEYWIRSQDNPKNAFESYLSLCKLGGSKPYTELLKAAGLKNPFEKGTIETITRPLKAFLDGIDDMSL